MKAYSDRCKATEQYVEMYRKQLGDTEDEMFRCKEDFVKSEAAFEMETKKNEQVYITWDRHKDRYRYRDKDRYRDIGIRI